MTDHAAASKRLPSGSRAGDPRERIPGWGTDRQEGGKVKATEKLHELGQSLWLDNITREMLDSGQLQTYIDDYSVTGLTPKARVMSWPQQFSTWMVKTMCWTIHEGLAAALVSSHLIRQSNAPQ